MSKKEKTESMIEAVNEAIEQENNAAQTEESTEQPQFEPGSYFWALDILIRAVQLGQKSGAYTLDEAGLISQAVYVVNNANITIKKD